MKIIERRVLRGPNLHSHEPCFMAVLDLEGLDEVSPSGLPGFIAALLPGGFGEPLREGACMAHVVEQVAIALQNLVGHDVGFGKSCRVRGSPRHHRVVVAYRNERVAARALDIAVDLSMRLASGAPCDIGGSLAELRALAVREAVGLSTRAIVEAARRRSIPTLRLTDDANLFQLGWGARQHHIEATTTSRTSAIAVNTASDKALTKVLLAEAGLPVPAGRTVTTVQDAQAAARELGRPVVVKPLDANQGKGVSAAVTGDEATAAAFERAAAFGPNVIVEAHVEGDDYRVLIVAGEVVAAARRLPPRVVGDGGSSVRELVERENAHPARGNGHENMLTKIPLDTGAAQALALQGLDGDSVPEHGCVVHLRGNANLSTGGTAEDVTDDVHPDIGRACVRAARKIGLDVAGIDIVCRDIRAPLAAQGGAIIEVNAAPGIRMHEHPSRGMRRPAGERIVDALFPAGDDGRIPVVAVTGSNGKTTTTLAIAHVLQRLGRTTGVATSEGICVGGQQVAEGDCTGYWSARTVLASPEVEMAVLETARGGILKRGLGFDLCDVGVVLNVQSDHLGLDGIDTLDELAEVKGLVAEVARKAVVLNAQDPRCMAMARRLRPGCEVVCFALDAAHPAFVEHLGRGGRGVYAQDGMLILANGDHRIPVVEARRLPFTLSGRARFNMENALAAIAALLTLGVARDRIAAELASFTSNPQQNPLRMNLFCTHGVTLLVDYAHNASAYRAIAETGRQLAKGRVIGVAAAPGDRRDDDLHEIGRVCREGFDELVFYEMDEVRDRPPGATAARLDEGARRVPGRAAPRVVLDVRHAIREAFLAARPGDAIVLGCASHLDDVREALAGLADIASVNVGALAQEDASDAAPHLTEEAVGADA